MKLSHCSVAVKRNPRPWLHREGGIALGACLLKGRVHAYHGREQSGKQEGMLLERESLHPDLQVGGRTSKTRPGVGFETSKPISSDTPPPRPHPLQQGHTPRFFPHSLDGNQTFKYMKLLGASLFKDHHKALIDE